MRNTVLLLAIVALSFFVSCKSKVPKTEQATTRQEAVTEERKEEKNSLKKYGIKSGIVEYASTAMGTDATTILMFDGYGAKEINQTVVLSITSSILITDGYMYIFNDANNTGTKRKIYGAYGSQVDFRNLTKEMMEREHIKHAGKEQYFGKTCDKYIMDNAENNMKGTFLVYEGLALKSDLTVRGTKTLSEVKRFEENVEIPAGTFKVPDNIQFTE